MATLTFRVEGGAPVAMSRSELVIFALGEHPDATGVVFLAAGHVLCRRCIDEGTWLLDVEALEQLDDRALVLFSPLACSLCTVDGHDVEGEDR
jgi:hypothetical protein